jgi:hypothetical protein
MAIRIGDIGFDDEGRLRPVFEAGWLRRSRWQPSCPVVFSIGPRRLC